MDMFRYLLLLCVVSFFACSTEKDPGDFPSVGESVLCCTQQQVNGLDSLVRSDSITNQTRANHQLQKVSLFSFGKNYENDNNNSSDYISMDFPIHNEYGNSYTDICLKADFSLQTLVTIDAINENGLSIPVSFPFQDWFNLFRSRSCYFSSVSANKVSLSESSIKTPKGQTTYSPLSGPVYVSDEYRFEFRLLPSRIVYKYDSKIHEISPEEHIKLDLMDQSSLLRARILLTEIDSHQEDIFDQITYELLRDRFRDLLGDMGEWTVSVFVDGVPLESPVITTSNLPEGDKILALCDKKGLESNQSHKEVKWRKTYNYLGIGLESWAEGNIMPFKTSDSYLKYSFYYTGDRKFKHKQVTLRVPIKDLVIERSCIYNITTIIDVRDLKDAVTGKFTRVGQRANYQISEDEEYGLVIDLPSVTLLKRKKR